MTSAEQRLEKLMLEAQQSIMSDIVRRIKSCGEISRTADWQFYRLGELGASQKYVKQELEKRLKMSSAEISRLYSDAAKSGYAHSEELYKRVGADFIPFDDNKALQQLVTAAVTQTANELQNISGSLGFAVRRNGKLVFKKLSRYYQRTLDNALSDLVSGASDYNTIIKRVVTEMTNSGLRTVDYATGCHRRTESAARAAVLTGMNQLTGKIQEQTALKLGTDKYEVSWHSTARPTHQDWQGRVYTKEELVSVCGLGDVEGLLGANCRHTFYPFVEGVSIRQYTDEQLGEMNAHEQIIKKYGEKGYTPYEATQRQRKLETRMRIQRQRIKLLEEGGADEKDITLAKCKYQQLSSEYTQFSKVMGLPQQRQRISVDGLGNIGQLSKSQETIAFTNIQKHVIINKNAKRIPQIRASSVTEKIKSGEYSTKLSMQQYAKHTEGTPQYEKYKQDRLLKGGNPQSILTIDAQQAQRLIVDKAGTGIVRVTKAGIARPVEDVNCDFEVGKYFGGGAYHDTTKVSIRYGKKGAHIIPIKGDYFD